MPYIGQQSVIARLETMIDAGLPVQSFLFVGPAHVGKRTLANAFAQAVIEKQSFVDILTGRQRATVSVDLIVCAPSVVKKKDGSQRLRDIGVTEIRAATAQMAQSPLAGARQVLIVDDADRMTVAAQNALLKTLEEPATTSVIILVTAREGVLLPTVTSRTERVGFTQVDKVEITKLAKQLFDSENDVQLAQAVAIGRPGLLYQCAQNAELLARYGVAMTQLTTLPTMTIHDKIVLAQELARDGGWLIETVELWMGLWREQLLDEQIALSNRVNLVHSIEIAAQLLVTLRTTNANARLATEDFLFRLQ